MIQFNFLVKKEACFAHWIRLMLFLHWPHIAIKWEKSDISKKCQYYFDIVNGFNDNEKLLLEQLKNILQRKRGVVQWFWDRYLDKVMVEKEILEVWDKVRDGLGGKFDKIWELEYPRLIKWQKILENDAFDLDDTIERIKMFFGAVEFNERIDVYLNIFFSDHTLNAETKKSENLMLLSISNLDFKYFNKVISILFHETTHVVFGVSQRRQVLKDFFPLLENPFKKKLTHFELVIRKFFVGFSNILHPKRIKIKELPWDYLIEESIVSSIAGQGVNYINQKFFPENIPEKEKEFFATLKYKDYKDNYSYQIKAVAYQFSNLTKEYLDNKKEMDKSYCDQVVKAWMKFRAK
jgi:hypothetical protein